MVVAVVVVGDGVDCGGCGDSGKEGGDGGAYEK